MPVAAARYPYPGEPSAPTPAGAPPKPPEDYLSVPAARPEAFGEQVGHAMTALGGVLTKSADEFAQVALERQNLHNKVVADSAVNTYNDQLTQKETAFYALHGQDAVDAFPAFRDDLVTSRNAMRDRLQNQMQQLDFDNETRRMQAMTLARTGIHYDQQYDVFQSATNKAAATLANQAMGSHFDDPAAFSAALADRMRADYRELQRQGRANDPGSVNEKLQQARTDAVKIQIEGYRGQGNIASAAGILEREAGPGGALSVTDANAFRTVLSDAKVGAAVDGAMGRGPTVPGTVGPSQPNASANLANFNFGNMKAAGGGYRVFATEEEGARAIGDWLVRHNQGGQTTIRELIDDPQQGYAPSTDPANAGKNLPEAAAKIVGVDPDAKVDMNDPALRRKMVGAIVQQEFGSQQVTQRALAAYDRGVGAAPPLTAGQAALATGRPDYAGAIARVNADPSLNADERRKALAVVHAEFTAQREAARWPEEDASRALKMWQTANEADLFAKAIAGQDLDPGALSWMVKNQEITPAGYNAVMAERGRTDRGNDDVPTVMSLTQRAASGEDVTQDVYAARQGGKLKGTTADTLLKISNERQLRVRDEVERRDFATLRTIAGMDATDHPLVDLEGISKQEQVAMWGNAQLEWNRRVLVLKENADEVLNDMAGRFGKSLPESVRQPRFGLIKVPEDVEKVWAATRAGYEKGIITDDQLQSEAKLIRQIDLRLQAKAAQDAAKATIPVQPPRSGRGRTP